MDTAHIVIQTLGGLQLRQHGQPLGTLASRKAEALLVYLAMTGRAQPRDHLATLLWDELPSARARGNLSVLLSSLRPPLGAALISDRHQVALAAGAVWCDAVVFLAQAQPVLAQADTSHPLSTVDLAAARQALHLYQGEFLHGFALRDGADFETWVQREQTRLHDLAVQLHQRCASTLLSLNQAVAGLPHARALLELDPFHEAGHDLLVRLLAATGQRAAALAHYEHYCDLLATEFGATPSPQLLATYASMHAPTPSLPRPDQAQVSEPRLRGAPPPLTSFIGRQAELARLRQWLSAPQRRLVSIVGPGGTGKTRLAWEAATQLLPQFRDGAVFVALAALEQPALLATTIADAAGLRLSGPEPVADQLASALQYQELLLVLDNYEHLVAAATDGTDDPVSYLATLLATAPDLRIIVTSRERLGLAAEHLLDLDGLAYPPASPALDPAALGQFSSVALLLERASAIQPTLSLEASAPAIQQICALVAGLPLGLELAAGLVRVYSLSQIADVITRDADSLATRQRDVPLRHRSLRHVFAHSWHLLGPEERSLLRRIAVFRGGFTAEAATRLGGEAKLGSLIQLLGNLIDKSLVRRDDSGRYHLHELVRQYAAEQLAATPTEAMAVQQHHLAYYAAWAETLTPALNQTGRAAALREVTAERDNLRAAWRYATDQRDGPALARLIIALAAYDDAQGHFQLSYDALASATAGLALQAEGLAALLNWQALFAERLGQYDQSVSLAERALAHAEAKANTSEASRALIFMGRAREFQGQLTEAISLTERALALARANHDLYIEALALHTLGSHYEGQGAYPQAHHYIAQSLVLRRKLGDLRGLAFGLNNMGVVLEMQADYPAAIAHYLESQTLFRELGDCWAVTLPLGNLGDVARSTGDLVAAERYYQQALSLAHNLGILPQILVQLVKMAQLWARMGRSAAAARLLAPTLAHPANPASFREAASRLLAELAIQLPAATLAQLLEEGRTVGVAGAISEALRSTAGCGIVADLL
ncbi:MAG: ATP-binding protein [Oscillochloridaceae bacterium umkhey_bin13]